MDSPFRHTFGDSSFSLQSSLSASLPFSSSRTTATKNGMLQDQNQYPEYMSSAPKNPMLYKTELCESIMKDEQCKFGINCWYAHGLRELRLKPSPEQLAKHKFQQMKGLSKNDGNYQQHHCCQCCHHAQHINNYLFNYQSQYQNSKNNVHPKKPLLYKTVLCEHHSLYGNCSFGADCWYAHGQNELRMKPATITSMYMADQLEEEWVQVSSLFSLKN